MSRLAELESTVVVGRDRIATEANETAQGLYRVLRVQIGGTALLATWQALRRATLGAEQAQRTSLSRSHTATLRILRSKKAPPVVVPLSHTPTVQCAERSQRCEIERNYTKTLESFRLSLQEGIACGQQRRGRNTDFEAAAGGLSGGYRVEMVTAASYARSWEGWNGDGTPESRRKARKRAGLRNSHNQMDKVCPAPTNEALFDQLFGDVTEGVAPQNVTRNKRERWSQKIPIGLHDTTSAAEALRKTPAAGLICACEHMAAQHLIAVPSVSVLCYEMLHSNGDQTVETTELLIKAHLACLHPIEAKAVMNGVKTSLNEFVTTLEASLAPGATFGIEGVALKEMCTIEFPNGIPLGLRLLQIRLRVECMESDEQETKALLEALQKEPGFRHSALSYCLLGQMVWKCSTGRAIDALNTLKHLKNSLLIDCAQEDVSSLVVTMQATERLLNEATEAVRHSRLTQALALLHKAASLHPTHRRMWRRVCLERTRILMTLGDLEGALLECSALDDEEVQKLREDIVRRQEREEEKAGGGGGGGGGVCDACVPYATLGVARGVSAAAVTKAYRRAAFQTHPDRAPIHLREERATLFKQVQAAFEVLSDKAMRGALDETHVCRKSADVA